MPLPRLGVGDRWHVACGGHFVAFLGGLYLELITKASRRLRLEDLYMAKLIWGCGGGGSGILLVWKGEP